MSETSWLAGAAVNGNTNVDNVLDVAEKLVQVGVGHLESEVADEEGLGWGVLGAVLGGVGHVVDDHAAAGEDGVVEGLDGLGGGVNVLEGNVTETGWLLAVAQTLFSSGKTYPLLNPRASCAILVDSTSPYGEKVSWSCSGVASKRRLPT